MCSAALNDHELGEAISPEHPGWHVWTGVAGLLYARWEYPKHSPPVIVRATSVDGLRDKIDKAENTTGIDRYRVS